MDVKGRCSTNLEEKVAQVVDNDVLFPVLRGVPPKSTHDQKQTRKETNRKQVTKEEQKRKHVTKEQQKNSGKQDNKRGERTWEHDGGQYVSSIRVLACAPSRGAKYEHVTTPCCRRRDVRTAHFPRLLLSHIRLKPCTLSSRLSPLKNAIHVSTGYWSKGCRAEPPVSFERIYKADMKTYDA